MPPATSVPILSMTPANLMFRSAAKILSHSLPRSLAGNGNIMQNWVNNVLNIVI
jgi:hypothetical protein